MLLYEYEVHGLNLTYYKLYKVTNPTTSEKSRSPLPGLALCQRRSCTVGLGESTLHHLTQVSISFHQLIKARPHHRPTRLLRESSFTRSTKAKFFIDLTNDVKYQHEEQMGWLGSRTSVGKISRYRIPH
jgi:hypothetical protein